MMFKLIHIIITAIQVLTINTCKTTVVSAMKLSSDTIYTVLPIQDKIVSNHICDFSRYTCTVLVDICIF